MTTAARLRVDPIACDGRGFCAEILPEMITLDDWGFPIIRDADVPAGLQAEAGEAVRLCPLLALRLDRSDSDRALQHGGAGLQFRVDDAGGQGAGQGQVREVARFGLVDQRPGGEFGQVHP